MKLSSERGDEKEKGRKGDVEMEMRRDWQRAENEN